ncbi:MAG: hypothetical protein N0E44_18120 [Candidatus Thiodiazotropha lotti]|nr:hypothetical protein [Candidatus Thiodiazotropha lotti]MCW4221800.1 hypothetical protein [Candidatus Thiodiazotropha lotti]
MNIFQHRLFHTAILAVFLVLFTVAAFADDECYSVELLYFTSDHTTEGRVDTHFDQKLFELGRSTSEKLFGEQRMKRYGAMASRCFWDGNSVFTYGAYIDPAGQIIGHSELGDLHVRQDSIGVFALGGYRVGRFTGYAGGFAEHRKTKVHSWLPVSPTQIEEHHDTYSDFSTGLMAKVTVDLISDVSASCNVMFDVGDMDTIGTSRVYGCGVRYEF